jgi:hypothetical protein
MLGLVIFVIICYREVYEKQGEDEDEGENVWYYFRDRKQLRIYVRI